MKRRALVAGLLSLFVPGLGQIYCGRANRGVAILVTAIIVASLNVIFLLVYVAAHPDPQMAWAYWIPRIGHDVISIWSVIYWAWAVADAFSLARRY
jgi:TM2 domain-containing membrane protein YozV